MTFLTTFLSSCRVVALEVRAAVAAAAAALPGLWAVLQGFVLAQCLELLQAAKLTPEDTKL